MRRSLRALSAFAACLLAVSLLGGASLDRELWRAKEDFFRIRQAPVGDYRDRAEDWENSTAFREVYMELEDRCGAFICSTWNYDRLDGVPRYELTERGDIPVEYDCYGYSITVSGRYFDHTRVEDVTGTDVRRLLTDDADTLDILVPEKYREDEPLITSIYQEFMYFNNVEVENIYNDALGRTRSQKTAADFTIHPIYVPDDTQYDVYDPNIGRDRLDSCIVAVVNAENYNRVQLSSAATQGLYVRSALDPAELEDQIRAVYEEKDFGAGYRRVVSVAELYDTYRREHTNTAALAAGGLCLLGAGAMAGAVAVLRRRTRGAT